MARKRKYDESSIQVLETDRDIVREKTTMFIPSRDEHGAMHVIFEIVDNSIDELMVKGSVGKDVTTTFDLATKEVTVTDNGSGIPQGRLYELCTRLYASGKYHNDENAAYEYTSGTNGVGTRLANYLSEYAEFTSMQKGKKLTYRFENGFKVGEKEEKCNGRGNRNNCGERDKRTRFSGRDGCNMEALCKCSNRAACRVSNCYCVYSTDDYRISG